jgi:hypothetical protein
MEKKFGRILTKLAIFTLALAVFLPAPAKSADNSTNNASLSTLIQEGKKLSRDYLIESAVMNVRLDNVTTESASRTAEIQITYTILALDTVTNFDEEYHSPITNAIVSRIRGSLPESDLIENSPDKKSWNVLVRMQPGQRETIVTACKYYYPGVPARRNIHEFHDLTPADDTYCYPNTEDVIGDLTIRIQSPLPVKPPILGDALLFDNHEPHHPASHATKPALYPPDGPGTSPFILVARWKNITPNQTAELKISR